MARRYTMPISRLTVDKLGVKLYDKVSAVIAELIANAYDADATEVTVRAPMGQFLATKAGGVISDKGLTIEVTDNGIGMTPDEMQNFYLVVGAERRTDPKRGAESRLFKRRVMGRKGVGKLAPFGICKTIEVISSGSESPVDQDSGEDQEEFLSGGELQVDQDSSEDQQGFLTSHIIMKYGAIVQDEGTPGEIYEPTTGERDDTISERRGTKIILQDFNYRRVPTIDDLARQIAQRFGIASDDWNVTLIDNSPEADDEPRAVGKFDIEWMPNTQITFAPDGTVTGPDCEQMDDLSAGFEFDHRYYPVHGWMGYAKDAYKDTLMAGVRIYCKGKIAAQPAIFNLSAGFTGEHNIRSYLVGELHADWLDEDDDLIQTDRRDILWSDELAAAFEQWGQNVVRRIGTMSRDPLREATLDVFLRTGDVDAKILDRYPGQDHYPIRAQALELAKLLGKTMNRSEAEDASIVGDVVELSIFLAPHATLDKMMRDAIQEADSAVSAITAFLKTARIAELSSFGRIAEDRLKVIDRLQFLKSDQETEEKDLQNLLDSAPWLINPEWAPVTANQSLSSLKREFEAYYQQETAEPITLADFRDPLRRPDFVLTSQESKAQIVEIKSPGHALQNDEMDRIVTYYQNIEGFLSDENNAEFRKFFTDFHITLVCDEIALDRTQLAAFRGYINDGKLTHVGWPAFLLRTELVHQDFLNAAKEQLQTTTQD